MEEKTQNPNVEPAKEMTEAELSELLQIRRDKLKALQDSGNYTELLVMQEAVKTLPFEAVWNEYCARYGLDGGYGWFTVEETADETV